MSTRIQSLVVIIVVAICSLVAVAQPRLVEIRPPGATRTAAISMSPNGRFVVGIATYGSWQNQRYFVWQDGGTFTFLDPPESTMGVNGRNSIDNQGRVYGWATVTVSPSLPPPNQASRAGVWPLGGSFSQLPIEPGDLMNPQVATQASMTNASGVTVFGMHQRFYTLGSTTRVTETVGRWAGGFFAPLASSRNWIDVSADGQTALSDSTLWNAHGGFRTLPSVPGTSNPTFFALSGNGSVAYGSYPGFFSYSGVRWTANTGSRTFYEMNWPQATNFDGSIVVGTTSLSGPGISFPPGRIATPVFGADINVLLPQLGTSIPLDVILGRGIAISDDGSRILCIGTPWPGESTWHITLCSDPSSPAPSVISTSPDLTLCGSSDATVEFTVTASGSSPLLYQWQALWAGSWIDLQNGRSFAPGVASGTSTPTLRLQNIGSAGSGTVLRCRVMDQCARAVVSNPIYITRVAPVIMSQPTAEIDCSRDIANFRVQVAESAGAVTYQWRKDGVNIVAFGPGGNPTAAMPELVVQLTDPSVIGSYDCVITSACGTVTSSSAVLSSLDCPPTFSIYIRDKSDSNGFYHVFVGLDEGLFKRERRYGFVPALKGWPLSAGRIQVEDNGPWSWKLSFPIAPYEYAAARAVVDASILNPPVYYGLTLNCMDWAAGVADAAVVPLPPFMRFTPEPYQYASPQTLLAELQARGDGGAFFDGVVRRNPESRFDEIPRPISLGIEQLVERAVTEPEALARVLGVPSDVRFMGDIDVSSNSVILNVSGDQQVLAVDWGDGTEIGWGEYQHVYSPGSYLLQVASVSPGAVQRRTYIVNVSSRPFVGISVPFATFPHLTVPNDGLNPATPPCDSIDFNQNTVFPEDQDVIDFFNVLAGGECSPGNTCNDIDFNNNQVFPEDQDVIDFFNVLAGGQCP
jgi:hypothetical protein